MGRHSRHRRSGRPRRPLRLASALFGAAWLLVLLPAVALAHPLGNFTINHYAGLTIGRDSVALDIVIDMAEIPAFQERQTMDADLDGEVGDDEAAAWAAPACDRLTSSLRLARDGALLAPAATGHEVSFPAGAGGLSTLRLECRFAAALVPPVQNPATFTFEDRSYTERIGWREIVAAADGTILDAPGLPSTSPSQKLTSYPADQLAQPLDIRSASIVARPAPGAAAASTPPAAAQVAPTPPTNDAPRGAVPGGVAAELPDIFRTADLTPVVLLLSLGAAIVLGAGHALTPGHGKTLMAAYLVGSRGTSVHAVGLGLSVAVSHTLGIFLLALLIVGAQGVLPPDVVVRTTPVIAAISIVGIGGWMLLGEVRRRWATRRPAAAATRAATMGTHTTAGTRTTVGTRTTTTMSTGTPIRTSTSTRPSTSTTATSTTPATRARRPPWASTATAASATRHVPAAGAHLSWRGLFVLGLAGGLIPSTSALLILLGSIAAGRPAFGLILVVAFGLGMAAVMTAVGLVMIVARTRLDRMPSRSSLGRLAASAPLLASVAVLGLGLVLTWSAVSGRPVL